MRHAMIQEPGLKADSEGYSIVFISKTLQRRRWLEGLLPSEEFSLRACSDARVALREILENEPDLVILHNESVIDGGLRHIQMIREATTVPLAVLNETKDDLTRIISLQVGADLVLSTDDSDGPYACEQVRALLRRVNVERNGHKTAGRSLTRGDLHLELDCHTVTWHGETVNLTRSLFKILHRLAERPMHVLSRENIQDLVYCDNVFVEERAIDSHIKRLRLKFREVDPDFDAIETIYGVGYRFREQTATHAPAKLITLANAS